MEDARAAESVGLKMCWPGFEEAHMDKEMTGSEAIDEKLRSLADWRGALLAKLRRLIH